MNLLPASAWAQACTTTSTLNNTNNATGNRKTSTETVGGTSFAYAGYTSSVPGTQTNTFSVGTNGALSGQTLVWQLDNTGNAGPNSSYVTLVFTRPVNNLTLQFQDLDSDTNFQDDLVFEPYLNGSSTPTTLTSANFTTGANNAYVTGGEVQGTNPSAAGEASGNLTATMPAGVTSLTIRYNNTRAFTTGANRTQTLGLNTISWCAQADVYARYTAGPTTATAGQNASYTVQFGNNGPDAAASGVSRQVTLPAGAVVTSNTGGTYSAANNTITYPTLATLASGASNSFTYSYTAPLAANSYDNVATIGATTASSNPTDNDSQNRTLLVTAASDPCTTAAISLNYATRPATDGSWKNRGPENAPTATSTTNVTTTYASGDANSIFSVAQVNGVQTLGWSADYTAANGTSTVTYKFSRAVSNLSVQVQDIDGSFTAAGVLGALTPSSGYTDEVRFTGVGSDGATAVTPTLTKVNTASTFFTINANTATANPAVGGSSSPTDASVIATFASPVTSLTIRYRNVTTATTVNNQVLGIDRLTWCRLAPVANDITNASRPSGQDAASINSLSATAEGTITSYTITALPPATQGTYYVNGVALTTAAFPGLVLTPTQATQLSFAPAASFSGTAGFTYIATDDAGIASPTATYAIPVTNTGAAGTPAACATAGKDGAKTLDANPDTYYPGTQSAAVNATSITVGAATIGSTTTGTPTTISKGDLLLVVQMQGADINYTNTDAYGDGVAGGGASGNLNTNFTAGTYEYVVANNTAPITAGTGGIIALVSGLKNSYINANATTTTGQQRFQVIRVPQYTTLTLSGTIVPTPWNGTTGGILALDVAGQTTFGTNAVIDASARGFRGGGGRTQATAAGNQADYVNTTAADANAQKGEGTAGTPHYVNAPTTPTDATTNTTLTLTTDGYPGGTSGRGAPGNAGGGGGNNIDNSGGGGGANGGVGGRGGNKFAGTNEAVGGEPGAYFGVVTSSRLVLGGGGGAGTTNNATGTPGGGAASSGAPGGGIVLLRTGSVSGTGSILANGGSANTSLADDGSGGGGAGGTILVTATNPAGLANIVLTANGGTGGSNTGNNTANGAHGPGGGGGGGVIFANSAVATASSATGGANGTTKGGVAFGSAAGSGGVSNTQISNSIANSVAGSSCIADVATTVTAPTNPVAAGQTATLNVAFVNNGALTATAVTRQVQLVAGLANVVIKDALGAVITGAAYNSTSGLVTYPNVASLANGGDASSVITFTAPAAGPVAVTSTIGTATADPVTENNTSSLSLGVTLVADVSTTLAGPLALNAGQPSGTFTATYTNYGPSAASSVLQTVTLPAGATNVLVGGLPYSPVGNVITFGTAATLASGATNTFTYSFTAPNTTGSFAQTSNVTTTTAETSATNNAATFTSTIGAIADVAATVSAANAAVATGQTGTFNVKFTNGGPNPAATPTLQVQLPANLAGISISVDAGTTASYNPTTGVVTYTYGTSGTAIPSGTTINSAISFTVPSTGTVTATAASGTTTNEMGRTANNAQSATVSATPGTNLATVLSGPASTVAGTLTTYSLVTTNNGPSAAAAVAQSVEIPKGLTPVYISNGGTYDGTSGVVTFPSLGTLASGSLVNNTISFVAPGSAITAKATVSTTTAETVLSDNTSTVTTSVSTASTTDANIYTTISTTSANVAPGAAVTFRVRAGNRGPNAATSVVESVLLPTGLTGGVTITDSTGVAITGASYNTTTGVVTLPTIGMLSSSVKNLYLITVNAPASGLLTASASIAATTNDVMMADNLATADVTVSSPGDVATTLTGPTQVGAGQAVTYTVTTTNNGLAPAANVAQTVNIPAGLASVTLSGSGTYDTTTGVVTFPNITSQASGNSVLNTITYVAPATTSLVNVALVSSASPDNVRTNNRSAVTTAVEAISDIAVSITGPMSIVQGNQVDYAIVTTNNGPSSAANVATRVQLPPGLGTVVVSNAAAGAKYDNATGIVTFPTIANQAPGAEGTVTNIIRFNAPSNLSQLNATATVSVPGTVEESNYLNNTASIITTETAPTAVLTNLMTEISALPTTPVAGQSISLTVTTTNVKSTTAAPTGNATGVVQRVALEAGLTIIGTITNGGTYDPTTGIVTFPAIALTNGTAVTNTIVLSTPSSPTLQARALVTGDQSDPVAANNTDFLNLTVSPRADIATTVSGPTVVATGDAVTYSVVTLNNGPSPAATVKQTVTIPSGLAAASVTISGGGTYNSGSGVVTFPDIDSQEPGAGGQVMNTISFVAPSTSFTVVGNVSTTTVEPTAPGTLNNSSTVTVAPGNTAPVANAVVNALQTPEGNTAGPLLISPLSATDANGAGTIASYRITSIPDADIQGVLTLNGSPLAVGSVVTAANAASLRFDPVTGFIGNAFFGYTATDDQGVVSAASALYTIPVGLDLASTYATYNAGKGRANPYVTGDVLAQATDRNAATYTTTGIIYDATTGVKQTTAGNGIGDASLAGAGPTSNPTNTLPSGVSLDAATGRIYVSNASLLVNNLTAKTYSVNVTTTDLFGGITTVPVTFTIGAVPLPVSLTAFTAQAVQNRDALLNWSTASELNNAYFDVERSLDGTTFVKVGQVAGQGTKSTGTSYTFTDAGIGTRTSAPVYYRLQQVDLDGTATYSPVRTVSFTQAAVALSLYPNPAQRTTQLDLSQLPTTGSYHVTLLDATGRTVLSTTMGGGLPQPLDLNGLATGTYNVLVTGTSATGTPLRQVLRLTKE
ncbi:T9SS type A sorting domain-containing protein [Hymenobacter ginkgonis]|uniref:T9SS type A sorting domain-containing protein n=1 Tax=Hymenobacter ginkgonis TaxID=2682976 RepID=UPI0018DCF0CD|nr:T9SS type A sorting domain-containing protein [Hymenobacter ginkgonis]